LNLAVQTSLGGRVGIVAGGRGMGQAAGEGLVECVPHNTNIDAIRPSLTGAGLKRPGWNETVRERVLECHPPKAVTEPDGLVGMVVLRALDASSIGEGRLIYVDGDFLVA
jgi:hypothetical protein